MSVQVCLHTQVVVLLCFLCAVVCDYKLQSMCEFLLRVYVRACALRSLQHSQSIISTDSRGRTMRENKMENNNNKKKRNIEIKYNKSSE